MDYIIALIGDQGIIIVIEQDTEEKQEDSTSQPSTYQH